MTGFLPAIYPDELIYSWFARYYQRSGYSAYIDAISDIYKKRTIRPDIEFINVLNADTRTIISKIKPISELVLEHTMFKYYARFLPVERRSKAFEACLNMSSNIHNLLVIPQNKGEKRARYVKYCPLCVQEDRELYSETYMHRCHQLRGTDICFRHKCALNETEIIIAGKVSPRFYPLENNIKNLDITPVESERELLLAEYVTEVFQAPLDLDNNINAGDFLHYKMAGTCYRSIRGEQRNFSLLCSDYEKFYQELPKEKLLQSWRIQKVLNGYRWHTYEISQLALFLGVSVTELTNMTLPDKAQEQLFDEKITELRNEGLSYTKIAKELNASVNTIKAIGAGNYIKCGTKQRSNNGGVKVSDWALFDRDMLAMVEQTAKDIYTGRGGRPHKVTVAAVRKALNLKDGQLKRMPLCMREIKSYSETQQQYWAREVVWAVSSILNAGKPLNWRAIRDLTNMRKTDLLSCLTDLKTLDELIYESVSGLIK